MAYEISLPTGRRMALFFYDGPISRAVGFEKLLSDGAAFASRLVGALSTERNWPQLVHMATDGETFGHHHRFGDMALAYALHALESGAPARLTNYGEYLERHPPTHLVEIWENSSWSCPHGIGRWKEDCGCATGAHPDWQQKWRAPLREALDWLRDRLKSPYEADAAGLIKDPWAARNEYIDLLLDRSPEAAERFLDGHQTHVLDALERVRILKLLELQRHAQLMYTSCGWYFDDISGIEAVQVLQYAGRVIQLAEELFGEPNLESAFLEILQKAPSNEPGLGSGRDVYRKFVKPAMVDKPKAVGHYAVRSLVEDCAPHCDLYAYSVDRKWFHKISGGRHTLAYGRCLLTSKMTLESSELDHAAVHLGDHLILAGARECPEDDCAPQGISAMKDALERADSPLVLRLMRETFGQSTFALGSLFRDAQRQVLETILKSTYADIEEDIRQRAVPLVKDLMPLGAALPPHFRSIAAAALHSQLLRAFEAEDLDAEEAADLVEIAEFWHIALDKEGLEDALREAIERLARKFRDHPTDLTSLRKLAAALRLAPKLPFTVNLYRTQNFYYDLLASGYPELRTAAGKGDPSARLWVEEFKELGAKLSFKVEPEPEGRP
jgi:hypothetical protein